MRKSDSGETIECRPTPWGIVGGSLLVSIVVAVLLMVNMTASRDGKPLPLVLGILGGIELAVFAGFGLYTVVHALRTRVRADRSGLRWRSIWHGWRSANWGEITDYYMSGVYSFQTGRSITSPVVVTSSGVIKVLKDLNHLEEFKASVQERATSARVSEWEQLGIRRVDAWPRVFGYWNAAVPRKITLHFCVYGIILALVAFGFMRVVKWYATLSTPAEVHNIILILTLGYFTLAIIPAWTAWQYYTLWKRRGESFTVTPETVCYENPTTNEIRDVPWSEISDYFYNIHSGGFKDDGYTLVLNGADEKHLTWKRGLIESDLLLAIVQKYAPPPRNVRTDEDGWRNKSPHESTGGSDPVTWQGSAVGMGGRVFRQKSATAMQLLSLFSILAVPVIVLCVSEWLKPGTKDERALALGMALTFALPTIWGWICFFCTRVETDDMGITHYTPFGKTYLPWFAVADYTGFKKGDYFILSGQNGKRMRFYGTLSGYEELRSEIERYAPPPKTGWKTLK